MNPSGPDAATQIVAMKYMADNGAPVLIAIALGVFLVFWINRHRAIGRFGRRNTTTLLAGLLLYIVATAGLYLWQWMQPPYPLLIADRDHIWCGSLPADNAVAWRDLEVFRIYHESRLFRSTSPDDVISMTVRVAARPHYADGGIRRSGEASCRIRADLLPLEDVVRLRGYWQQAQQRP